MDDKGSPGQASDPASFLTPLLISLAGVGVTSMAILAYHLVLVRYCIRRQTSANSASRQIQGRQTQKGLEQHLLNAIPIYSYSRENGNSLRIVQSECVICLGELEEGDKIRLLPSCGHLFHVPCIDDWFLAHKSCPICRAPITSVANWSTGELVSDREAQNSVRFLEQGGACGGGGHGTVSALTWQQSNILLRHSLSLALPTGRKGQHFVGLKRSLSMDQTFVVIDAERGSDNASCSSSSPSLKGTFSTMKLDSMSSRLLRTFSQSRNFVTSANGILPL